MQPILHVIVVGFHHKRGCQMEYCYPPLGTESDCELPKQWANLPSLALPDGAHNVDKDVIYFLLPSLDETNRSIFGISCYRQIASKELIAKSDDVTRSTVQKSVCVLSRLPLFGVLKAKLELITQAYFNERDFAKVEVLSQMYNNLSDFFDDGSEKLDPSFASIDVPVTPLILTMKHRLLMLFKLILLERKVLFFISPVEKLCETMIGLISLFPRLLEEGLMEAAAYSRSECLEDDSNCDVDDLDFERVPESGDVIDSVFPEKEEEESKEKKNMKNRLRSKLQRGFDAVRGAIPVAEEADSETVPPVFTSTLLIDSYGFPLSIFTKGNLFHPYLSISYLDMIRSNTVRAYTIGATNALFRHRCDLVDVSITIDDATGELQLDLSDPELKKQLVLSTADLRFGDFLQKTVESRRESLGTSWDGGDEWLRLQFRAYLLSLMATVRSGLSAPLADFNEAFVEAWQNKHNFLIWSGSDCPDLANSVPGHPFAGQLSMSDVLLRVEHTIGFEPGRRVANAVASGSKYVSDTSRQLKSGISSWLRKPPPSS